MKRFLASGVLCATLLLQPAAAAFADNPHTDGTPGQPSQSCEEQPAAPPGFSTDGFANAQAHYNSGSQYDVACYQVSQH